MDNITTGDLQSMVDDLNLAFDPICIDFEICETEFLINYNFANYEDSVMQNEMKTLYDNGPYIDIYLVENFTDPAGASGFATVGGISVGDDAVFVMSKYGGSGTLIHEMGHFFGLYHTFETEEFGVELVDGSNCDTAGDLICDTPADPYTGETDNCNFISTTDANGDYHIPQVENYMGYYSCACRFTHQQYERMADTYLIDPKAHW